MNNVNVKKRNKEILKPFVSKCLSEEDITLKDVFGVKGRWGKEGRD